MLTTKVERLRAERVQEHRGDNEQRVREIDRP